MPTGDRPAQQLHAVNLSVNIGEAMEARTKDPLWFLARQWQLGEFAAENGGRPASLSMSWREFPLKTATVGGTDTPLQLDQPLELAVEQETSAGAAPAWRSAELEYAFSMRTDVHRFAATEYHGRGLDWYHFDYEGTTGQAAPEIQHRRLTPTQLYVRGAPHPRWWRFEDSDAYFDSPEDPEPNVLSTLLPELFFVDVNNWYIAPLPSRSGTLREVVNVTMVDSFGVATTLPPVIGTGQQDWRIFSAAPATTNVAPLDGRFLLLPHIAIEVLQNDDVEDVRFMRDEEANLVWAFEHRYRAADGTVVVNGDQRRAAAAAPTQEGGDALPRFMLTSETQPEWIPYVPRHIGAQGALASDIYLRRARSVENASRANPQYRSVIVGESWRLQEEEVPPSGLRVRRITRYARGSDGQGYHWIGRQREVGRRMVHPDLRFDFVEEGG